MPTQDETRLLELIRDQCQPALGCTEPAAVAYAAAVARRMLGADPELLRVSASGNILKNAMGVGIPGTDLIGLPAAVALGVLCGDADAGLSVLHRVTPPDVERAKAIIEEQRVTVRLQEDCESLYIRVRLEGGGHSATVVIEGTHTNVTQMMKDDHLLPEVQTQGVQQSGEHPVDLSIAVIDRFIRTVDWETLAFVEAYAETNEALAQEGLSKSYGMGVGKSIYDSYRDADGVISEEALATAITCAAVDARMSGCMMPAISSCGSGNQGLMATLPIATAAKARGCSREETCRALGYSLLITIHVKQHIGKLSPVCACGAGASIGTACALAYLGGGSAAQVEQCIQNVVADVAGIICDGAKAGCSLKAATGVASAYRGSMLALRGRSATSLDGIVGVTAEDSIDNLGDLGNVGMAQTDRVILEMLVGK